MNYSREELSDMLFVLGESERNCFLAKRIYAQKYPDRRHPQEKCFRILLNRFLATGSVNHQKKERRKNVLTEENQLQVLLSVVEEPHTSVRKISKITGIKEKSVHRIIQQHKYHPYKIQLHQELMEPDFLKRREFCNWAIEKINQDEFFFKYVLFSDEATFHKNGFVNRHNFHYYSVDNQHLFRTVDRQHRWTLNVWAGILGNKIIGPHFFDRTLDGVSYLQFLENDLLNYLDDIPLNILARMWLQHDGCPAHYSALVRTYLDREYFNKWIGRGGPISWPPRSPDLTKLDFFLWGYVRDLVYCTPLTTREDMKARIRGAFETITPEMLDNVEQAFKRRLQLCLNQNGGHFEQLC